MAGANWLKLAVAVGACHFSGCIVPGYDGVKLARNAGPTCAVPLEARNATYLFVLGGNNPREMIALERFRLGINAAGYAKVAAGPNVYASWMAGEMRRLHQEEPSAVFIIAGLESSAAQAATLSDKALAEGIPVQAVALVDSTGKVPGFKNRVRTLLVGSSPPPLIDPTVQSLVVPVTSQYGLPAEHRTVTAVVELLNEIAARQPLPLNQEAVSDWVYPFGREVPTSLEPRPDSEWAFMFDRPGGTVGTIEEAIQARTPTPATGTTTAAKP